MDCKVRNQVLTSMFMTLRPTISKKEGERNMGVFLNPGNSNFKRACHSEIYVDKTGLIELTNKIIDTEQRFICISRPRRFGKSMAANMLAAYYGRECNSEELFHPYKIAKCENYENYLNQYNVIALNMQNFLSISSSIAELIAYMESKIITELREYYPGKISESVFGVS